MKGKWIAVALILPVLAIAVVRYRRGAPQPAGTLKSAVAVGTHKFAWENEVEGAHDQAAQNARYDASYVRIAYPNGDVPINQGACTDVVIRSLRHAGYDLQALIHEDMKKRFKEYPRREAAPDS